MGISGLTNGLGVPVHEPPVPGIVVVVAAVVVVHRAPVDNQTLATAVKNGWRRWTGADLPLKNFVTSDDTW